jgi:uncharacterized protein (DUF58 family)
MRPEDFLKRVRAIEIMSRQLIKEGFAGDYRSAFKGSGMQFKEFRNYVYGDDVRHISWTVSARSQAPVLKTFEEERDRTLFLVVDVSASLRKGPWAIAKAERIAEIAATLALSASLIKDKVGLLLFTDQVELVVPPAKGQSHVLRIVRDILAFEPKGQKTEPNIALRQLDRVLKKHSIVVLLSDLEVLPQDRILRQTASHHEFLTIQVQHPGEWSFPRVPAFIELQGAESGRPITIDASSNLFRSFLEQQGQLRAHEVNELYKKSGVPFLQVLTSDDFIPPLKQFFARRHR